MSGIRSCPWPTSRAHRLLRAIVVVMLTAGWLFLRGAPLPALGHSVIETALPPPNASLESPPQDLVLRFSEPIDATFSASTVHDREGRQVSAQPVFSRDDRQVTVPITVGRGIYTVRWRVLSAVDGHMTTGFFAFAVGVPIAQEGSTASEGPSPAIVLLRWIWLMGAILLAGITFFQATVLSQSLTSLSKSAASHLIATATSRLRVATVAGAWILLASSTAEFVLQSLILLDTPLRTLLASGALWRLLMTTRAGWGVLIRSGMTLVLVLPWSPAGRILKVAVLLWVLVVGTVVTVLGGLSAFAGPNVALVLLVATVYGLFSALMALIVPQIPDVQLPPFAWTAPLASGVLLAGVTLTSHAAGIGPIALILDWVHLAAVTLWLGGLGALAIVLLGSGASDRALLAQTLVGRFSTVAGVSLAVVVATGIYSAWVHLPNLEAFLATTYGRTLLIKLLLIIPLIALGAVNRYIIRPRLAGGPSSLPASLVFRVLRFICSEVGVGSAVLLVVAALTITPPARVSMPAVARAPLVLVGMADDFTVRMTVAPTERGWNRLAVVVSDQGGQHPTVGSRILLRFTKLDENLDRITVPVSLQRGEEFILEGGYLGLPGYWSVDVIIRVRGQADRSASFPLRIGEPLPTNLDVTAVQLFDRARTSMDAIRGWRQVDHIADGAGGFVVTWQEYVRPDRVHYRTSSGGEAILIGTVRYIRENSPTWRKDTVAQPPVLRGPYIDYLDGAQRIRRGREDTCDGEACQVVLWDLPQVPATMIGWIGLQTARIHELMMVAPAHYMTSWPSDFDRPITILPPR